MTGRQNFSVVEKFKTREMEGDEAFFVLCLEPLGPDNDPESS